MAKFRKVVLNPGKHRVGRLNGKTEVVDIDRERIADWVKNTKKLRGLGVSIPAPFAHQDTKRNFPMPVRIGDDGASLADAYTGEGLSWDSSMNGGFWEELDADPKTGALVGVVESPGDENDANSPAGKIGKVVKETSVLVMPARKVLDSTGNEVEIGEHLAHVAMCLHPAEPGQPNFKPIKNPKGELALAMSLCMADQLPASPLKDPIAPKDEELSEAVALLASVCYVALPADVTRETVLQFLIACLRQKAADEQEKQKDQDSITNRPEGAETKSPTIAMSEATKKTDSSDVMVQLFMSNLVKRKRASLKDRIDKLVASGRIAKTYADEKLYPKVGAIIMSPEQVVAAKGEDPRDPLEDLIEGLEQAQPIAGSSLVDDEFAAWQRPADSSVQQPPSEGAAPDLSETQMDEIVNDALAYA